MYWDIGNDVWTSGYLNDERAEKWLSLSGGDEVLQENPQQYAEAQLGLEDGEHDVPDFGSLFQAEHSGVLNFAEAHVEYAKVLHCIAYLNPTLSHAPWIPPLTAACLGCGMSEKETFAVVTAFLKRSDAALPTSKLGTWVMLMVFDTFARKENAKAVHDLLEAERYGVQIYHASGDVTVDFSMPPPPLGSRRHPLCGVVYEWISLLRGRLLLWAFDVIMDMGPTGVYFIGMAMLEAWAHAPPADPGFPAVTINEVINSARRPAHFAQYFKPSTFKHKAHHFKRWANDAEGVCHDAVIQTGRILGATEFSKRRDDGLVPGASKKVLTAARSVLATSDIFAREDAPVMQALWSALPQRFQLNTAVKVFSTDVSGYSLQSFYDRTESFGPLLMFLKTSKGEVIGAFLSHPWETRRLGKGTRYFGGGETFIFTLYPEYKVYKWAGSASDEGASGRPTPLPAHSFKPAISQLVHLTMVVGMAVLSVGEDDGGQTLRRKSGVHNVPLEGANTGASPDRRGRRSRRPSAQIAPGRLPGEMPADGNVTEHNWGNDEFALLATSNTGDGKTEQSHPHGRDTGTGPLTTVAERGSFGFTDSPEHTTANVSPPASPPPGDSPTENTTSATPPAPMLFMMGTTEGLFIGGGGSGHAIALDDELHRGSSASCTTFNNRPLVHGDFTCDVLEAYYVGDRETEIQPVSESDLASRYGNTRRVQTATPIRRSGRQRSTRAKRVSRNLHPPTSNQIHHTAGSEAKLHGGTVAAPPPGTATITPSSPEPVTAGAGAVVGQKAVLKRSKSGATTLVRRQTATFGSNRNLLALDTSTRTPSGSSDGPSPTSVRRTKEPCMGRRKSITGGMSLNIQYDVPTTPAQWSETSESIFKSPVVPQPTSRPSTGVNVSTHPRQDFTAFLHRAHNQNTTTWIKTPPRSEVTDAPPDITSPRERTASGTASTSANSVVSPSATRARNKASFV
eukprot:m.161126 g.161126  ORF g.161126 m.161126 type:complete len:964 (+) comp18047_c1_seq5:250-3141(+)